MRQDTGDQMPVQISAERPIVAVDSEYEVTTGDRVRAYLGFAALILIWVLAIAIAILMITSLSDTQESSTVLEGTVKSVGPQPGLFSDVRLEDGAAPAAPEVELFDFGVIHYRATTIQNQTDGLMTYYAGLDELMAAGNPPPRERVVAAAQRLNSYQIEIADLKKNLPAGSEVRGGLALDRINGSVAAYRRAMDSAFVFLFTADRAEIDTVAKSMAEAQRLRSLGLVALDAENARVSVAGYYDAKPSLEVAEHVAATR